MTTKLLIGSLTMGATIFLTGCASTPTPPTTAPVAGPGEHCGGNMMNAPVCGTGYHCVASADSHLPVGDVGGTCVTD